MALQCWSLTTISKYFSHSLFNVTSGWKTIRKTMSGFKLKILSPNFSLLEVMCFGANLVWTHFSSLQFSTTSTRRPLELSERRQQPQVGRGLFTLDVCETFPVCSAAVVSATRRWVFLHSVGVQLEGWEASEETKLLAGCRPYSECSSYNQTSRCSLVTHKCFIRFTPCFISSGFVLHIHFREWD